jgi:hypothetical protein
MGSRLWTKVTNLFYGYGIVLIRAEMPLGRSGQGDFAVWVDVPGERIVPAHYGMKTREILFFQ